MMVDGLKEFISDNDIKIIKIKGIKYLILYKAVKDDFDSWFACDRLGRHSPGAYKIGNTVKCRLWDSDRSITCSDGLHVGTFSTASNFCGNGSDYLIEVLVNQKM